MLTTTKLIDENGKLDTFELEAEEGLLAFLRPPKGLTGMEATEEEILQASSGLVRKVAPRLRECYWQSKQQQEQNSPNLRPTF